MPVAKPPNRASRETRPVGTGCAPILCGAGFSWSSGTRSRLLCRFILLSDYALAQVGWIETLRVMPDWLYRSVATRLDGALFQDVGQECFGPAVFGGLKYHLWWGLFKNTATVNKTNRIRQFAGKSHFMGGQDHGRALVA